MAYNIPVFFRLAGVMSIFFAVVREANSQASEVDKRISRLAIDKERDIGTAIMKAAKDILSKHRDREEEISQKV